MKFLGQMAWQIPSLFYTCHQTAFSEVELAHTLTGFCSLFQSFITLNVMMKDIDSYFKNKKTLTFCHFEYWKIVPHVALCEFLFEWQSEKYFYMYICHSSWISHMYCLSYSAFLLLYFSDLRNLFWIKVEYMCRTYPDITKCIKRQFLRIFLRSNAYHI